MRGSMKRADYLLVFLVISGCFGHIKSKVISFGLASGNIPRLGSSVELICTVTKDSINVALYKTNNKNIESTTVKWSTCSPGECQNFHTGYTVTRSESSVNIKIAALSRAEDEKWWTCDSTNAISYKLLVYNIPESITLEGQPTCDLGISPCILICKTKSCTYPRPKFIWIYADENGASSEEPLSHGRKTEGQESYNCTDVTKIFTETLSLTRYTFFNDNKNKTIQIWCKINFEDLTGFSLQSTVSVFLSFAVKVSTVSIYDGQTPLQNGSILPVDEFQEKILNCVPGFGNPLPTTLWYIGSIKQGSEPIFKFTPNNTFHNKHIYCEVANFPSAQIVSAKLNIYVRVKIKNVYIEPASDSSLTVIQDTQEPVICATSGGRPNSTIKWLKLIGDLRENLGSSDNVHYIYTNSGLEVTKGTKTVTVSRQDSDWKLSCEASNFQTAAMIAANNSKSFNVLYPPEKMNITQLEKNGPGSSIEVVRGSNVSLHCSADSNPPVDTFSWNNGASTGRAITIKSIQNNLVINCTAENKMRTTSGYTISGVNSITKEIKVLYGSKILELIMFVDGIQKNEDTITVEENKSVSLRCQADSNPVSDIILYRAAEILRRRKTTSELVYNISSTLCKDNNRYICRASNGIPTDDVYDEKGLRLNVKCSPTPVTGTIFSIPASPNGSTVLSITFHAYPVPTKYTWFKNSSNEWVQVTENSSFAIANSSLEFNLTIRNVKKENYGEYNLTVENGIGGPVSYIFILKHQEKQEFQEDGPDDQSPAALIGGVVGGLLLVCLVIIGVVYFLRRRTGFDEIKKKMFKSRSSASKEGVTNQEDQGQCYENPMMLDVSSTKGKTPMKVKNTKPKDKKKTSHSHDGLMYADVVFQDNTKSDNKRKKGTAADKPKVSEAVVYDAIQFGVVGEPFHQGEDSNRSERTGDSSKK